ncbi:MAG: NYN domain-containing protein [Meiothermus sp.]|uniref:NYN domain-containing protein n=1 Tax=Meiothermus sp. TaxID=1955249 RepID=UPI0025F86EDF|nr:NYN domain-containing protein [Meiothermus sp.]MCS7059510.1 NYN domain-containing protein [Meiothermus sp.]MCS7193587.1 NYN domain-containing protein [Meiothermus sp.]MDW8090600.1 NYN domain-containing protein [Meiothermus sp.]MDW8480516.1 NYN domain-containing protein [Meiothermus sp.]
MNTRFNTAIFYDIENLLKGYSFSQRMLANLSLSQILEEIKRTEKIGQIAVQRAYANWSDPRLAIMRGEINELGIDPIQVFGFSREPRKNAADLQLAIDAVDLAHVRPALEVFVIVSGDGGFAALAKKLHEYGKTVIGCAYRSSASSTFQAVCDAFVWIPDPEEEERQDRPASQTQPSAQTEVTDPRNVRLARQVKKTPTLTLEAVVAKTREILDWYTKDAVSRADLMKNGINLSVVQEAIRYAVPGFQPIKFGFTKFVEYMQFACKDSELCIARLPGSQVVVVGRGSVQSEMEVLPDLDLKNRHSVDTYRFILSTGSPILRLPSPGDLYAISSWLVQNPIQGVDLGTAIENLVGGLSTVSSEAAKLGLLSLISAGLFLCEPEGAPLSEQKITLRSDVPSASALIETLKSVARKKIEDTLSEVREEVLQQLLPDVA